MTRRPHQLWNGIFPQGLFLHRTVGAGDTDAVVFKQVVYDLGADAIEGLPGIARYPFGGEVVSGFLPDPVRAEIQVFANGSDRDGERRLVLPAVKCEQRIAGTIVVQNTQTHLPTSSH
jgi:hypothetical protein